MLEIVTTLGRILPKSNDEKALDFLKKFREADKFTSPETEIAYARVAPKMYVESLIDSDETIFGADWRAASAVFQGLGDIAALEANAENDLIKSQTRVLLIQIIGGWVSLDSKTKATDKDRFAIPDLVRAFAAFKSENTSNIFRPMLEIRAGHFHSRRDCRSFGRAACK